MEKILIVEDDRLIRETLSDMLELSGYQVSTARNGEEGLQKIIQFSPRLVICDVQMPGIDGVELAQIAKRKLPWNERPTFIFLTAKVERNEVSRGVNSGAAAYIQKPFNHMCLLCIVNQQLKEYVRSCTGCVNENDSPMYVNTRPMKMKKQEVA